MTLSPITRYALYLLLAAGLLFVGFAYRSHVYETGVAAGEQRASDRLAEARLLASRADAAASERAARLAAANLQSLKASHDRVTRDLKAALAASDLRAARLDARIAGLLDEAAGLRAGPPADPGAPRGPAGTAEGDSTIALLIETTNENLSICRRNSERLGALQSWYETLRAGRNAGQE